MSETRNILIVGVGGQGVLKASQVLSEALVRSGYDVKQSEVHGMAQRGGSVVSEVRYGDEVHSPLAAEFGIDFIVALDDREGRRSEHRLDPDYGRLIGVPAELDAELADRRSRNIAALGRLSSHMDIEQEVWRAAVSRCVPPKTVEANLAAFEAGRRFEN